MAAVPVPQGNFPLGQAQNAQAQAHGAMNQQFQAAVGPAGGAAAAAKQPDKQLGESDRYLQNARENMATAFLGTSSVEMLRDATKGKEDIPRKIRMSINKQYFTSGQVMWLMAAAACFSLGLGTVIIVYTFDAVDYSFWGGPATNEKIAFFFVGFWVAAWFTGYETRGARWCDPDNDKVRKQKKQKADCLDDTDCSITEYPISGSCTLRKKHWLVRRFRQLAWVAPPIAFAGAFFGGKVDGDRASTTEERYSSAMIGLMIGVAWMMFFA